MSYAKVAFARIFGDVDIFTSSTSRSLWFARHALRILMLAQVATCAWGQSYPEKPVRWIATGSPGSGGDTLARLIASGLAQSLGQPVVVENRQGGASNIGAEIAARAAPDGYTLFFVAQSHAANVTLFRRLPYDLMRDFAPVTLLALDPATLTVHPSLPVKSVINFVKFAKARPGEINYASGGLASFTFIATEMFKAQAGINLVHVPYRGGGPALIGLLSGESPVMFTPIATALPHIRQGKIRPLGVATAKRLTLLPELPTVAESGFPGYESSNWFGLLVPAQTPKETITKIHEATISALNQPDLNKKLNDRAYVVVGNRPEEMTAYMNREVERLGKLIRALKLTAD